MTLYTWSAQSFTKERAAGFSSKSMLLTNKSNCFTYTVASLFVCISPLAVITVVGLVDVVMVSNSAELRSFLMIFYILAPESTTNSLSSGSFAEALGRTHFSCKREECSLVFLFEFVHVFGKVPCHASGTSLFSFSLFMGLVFKFRSVETSQMRNFDLYFTERWTSLCPDICLT